MADECTEVCRREMVSVSARVVRPSAVEEAFIGCWPMTSTCAEDVEASIVVGIRSVGLEPESTVAVSFDGSCQHEWHDKWRTSEAQTTFAAAGLSQCSTLVNGKWRFSATWGSGTPEPIELKFGTVDYVWHPTPQAKLVYAGLRVYGGVGVKT